MAEIEATGHGLAVLGGLLLTAGLTVGSFLNVVIHRLPIMLSRAWRLEASAELGAAAEPSPVPFNLAVPRSHCPACGARIKVAHNIPVLGWLRLRGRCAACAAPISPRYPIVELLGLLAALAAVLAFGLTWAAVAAALCLWTLIALSGLDLEAGLLPDRLTLPLLWCGLLANLSGAFAPLASAVGGAAAGYLLPWAAAWAFKLAAGREGMGRGDFKLCAAIGAWLGWQALPAVLALAAAAAVLCVLPPALTGRRDRNAPIRFGPFLAAAGGLALVIRPGLDGLAGGSP